MLSIGHTAEATKMTTSIIDKFPVILEKYKEPGEINRVHFISCNISKIVPFQYVINREISRCFIFFLGTERLL